LTAALVLAVVASGVSAQEYMGLLWNQTVKEVLSGLDVGDVNGDGKMEVAVSGSSDGLLYLYSSQGKLLWKRDMASYVNTVAVADINGDRKAEIMVGHADMYVFDGQGNRTARYNTQNPVYDIRAGDFNGDGVKDILLASYSKGECKDAMLIALDGQTKKELWKYDVGKDLPFDIDLADYNGDGRDEVVVGVVNRAKGSNVKSGCEKMFSKPSAILFLGSGGNLMWQYQTPNGVVSVGSGDVNGDGKLEVVAGGYPGVYVVSGQGSLLWSESSIISSYVEDIAAADLDGDKRAEVITGSNAVHVFSPEGKLLWTGVTDSRTYSLAAGDVDNDKLPDIVAGSGSLYVFSGRGDVRWKGPNHVSYGFIRLSDLDGNGYKEAVVGSVKNVYVFQAQSLAKKVRADELYRAAVALSSTNPGLAVEKFTEAKELYRDLNLTQEVTDCINQIQRLSDTGGRVSALRAQADADYNMSLAFRESGDYVNASVYAFRAQNNYMAPQINDRYAADKCDTIIEELKAVIASNASNELQAAKQAYDARDYQGSLTHAEKAEEYYEFIGDVEMNGKASTLAANLRQMLGIKETPATQQQAKPSKIPDVSAIVERIKTLNPVLMAGIIVLGLLIIALLGLTAYFSMAGGRKTLDVEKLHKARYPKEEAATMPKADEAPNLKRKMTYEGYKTSDGMREPDITGATPITPVQAAYRRRQPTVEKYRTGDEKGAFDDVSFKPPERPRPLPRESPVDHTLRKRPAFESRYSATSDTGRVELKQKKGIQRFRECRMGLCLKTKHIKRGVVR